CSAPYFMDESAGPTAAALGVLIGARLSDTIASHALLYTVGYRPNPGFSSTPLYVIEAFFWLVFPCSSGICPLLGNGRHGPWGSYFCIGFASIARGTMVVARSKANSLVNLATHPIMGIN